MTHDHDNYLGHANANEVYYGTRDVRKVKRIERKVFRYTEVYFAHLAGDAAFHDGKPYRNPYPAGRRHDAFKRSYELGYHDHMGDHHGRNV